MKKGKEWLQDKIQKQEQKVLRYLDNGKPIESEQIKLWNLENIYSTYMEGLKYKELKKAVNNNETITTFIGWNQVEIKKIGNINE